MISLLKSKVLYKIYSVDILLEATTPRTRNRKIRQIIYLPESTYTYLLSKLCNRTRIFCTDPKP